MNKFDKLYNKIITEMAGFDYEEANKIAQDDWSSPKQLHDLIIKVLNELGVDKGGEILQRIASNQHLAAADFKTLADCGGNIEKQLFLTLTEKIEKPDEEMAERHDKYIKAHFPHLKSHKDKMVEK